MIAELRFIVPAAIFILVLILARVLWPEPALQGSQSPWLFQLALAALAGLLGWVALWAAEHFLAIHFLAGGPKESPAAESSWWTSLAYFIAMVLGMMAQAIWHAIDKRTAGKPPVFDKWEFVKPALVAPIVFIAVYNNVTQAQITVVMLLFSFQNGFFWQTVLRKQKA